MYGDRGRVCRRVLRVADSRAHTYVPYPRQVAAAAASLRPSVA